MAERSEASGKDTEDAGGCQEQAAELSTMESGSTGKRHRQERAYILPRRFCQNHIEHVPAEPQLHRKRTNDRPLSRDTAHYET